MDFYAPTKVLKMSQLQQDNKCETDEQEVESVLTSINKIQMKHGGQYIENIVTQCQSELGWDRSKTVMALKKAVEKQAVREVKSKGKISYRIVKSTQSVPAKDKVASEVLQTIDVEDEDAAQDSSSDSEPIIGVHCEQRDALYDDFIDFKRLMTSELGLLTKAATETSSTTNNDFTDDFNNFKKFAWDAISELKAEMRNIKQIVVNKNTVGNTQRDEYYDYGNREYERRLFRNHDERILSLERQLDAKQRIIESMINCREQPSGKQASPSVLLPEHNSELNIPKACQSKVTNNTERKNSKEKVEQKNQKSGKIPQHLPKSESTETKKSVKNDTKAINETVQSQQPKKDKQTVTIIGDSILNGLKERGLSGKHHVRVRAHPGATSLDLTDHIKPIARRKPDIVIIHCGTNDLTNSVDTEEYVKKTLDTLREECPEATVAYSMPTIRKDRPGLEKKVKDLVKKMKAFCTKEGIDRIDNENIDTEGLGIGKLHLNRKGNSQLARNFINYIDH